MVNLYRTRPEDDDVETIPLSDVPRYTTFSLEEEQDLADEPLPSYSEALRSTSLPPRRETPTVMRVEQVLHDSTLTEAEHRTRLPGPSLTRSSRRRYCWLTVGIVAIVFLALGLFRCRHYTMQNINDYSAVKYVQSVAYPMPPTATYGTSFSSGESIFLVFIVLAAITIYPLLIICLQILNPSFILPGWVPLCCPCCGWLEPKRPPRKTSSKRGTAVFCWSTTLIYLALFLVAIVLPLELASSRQKNLNAAFGQQDTWAAGYLEFDQSIANGSISSFFSMNGKEFGTGLELEQTLKGWTMQTNLTQLNAVNYQVGPSFNSTMYQVDATCGTADSESCLHGYMLPSSLYAGEEDYTTPDFLGNLSIMVSTSSPSTVLNLTTNTTTLWTSYQFYQGIGLEYPPLGYWYLADTPIVQVLWSSQTQSPCDGLQIYLSGQYLNEALVIVGFVWQSWNVWGEYNGCEWNGGYIITSIDGQLPPDPNNDRV